MANWVTDIDMLAANGVIDYDAAAHLRGIEPRYVGNPQFRTGAPNVLPSTAVLHQSPPTDTFSPTEDKSLIKNPTWKKILFAAIAGGALIFGGIKLKGCKPMKWAKTQLSNFWDWIKKPFTKKP